MSDHAPSDFGAPEPAREEVREMKSKMMPVEVTILTSDHEIHGIIYVSRETRPERRLTDMLNGTERRFLAIKDVEVVSRKQPSTARMYDFMQIHIDNILMIHPSAQTLAKHTAYSKEEALRLDSFREKLRRSRLAP